VSPGRQCRTNFLSISPYDEASQVCRFFNVLSRQLRGTVVGFMSVNLVRSRAASEALPRAGAASILDRTVFDALAAEISEEVVDRALRLFFEETEGRLRHFRRLSCQADREAIGHEAHSLKGSAGTFGLCELSGLAAALERDAAIMTASDYARALDRLDAANASCRAQFPDIIATASTREGE
jgi:HPt (histidine-containing phosphotransfer) domain-containing protein